MNCKQSALQYAYAEAGICSEKEAIALTSNWLGSISTSRWNHDGGIRSEYSQIEQEDEQIAVVHIAAKRLPFVT